MRRLVLCLAGALAAAWVLWSCSGGTFNPPPPPPPDCTDNDGDGFGRNCEAGPDCDDSDPAHHNDCEACASGDPVEGCPCDDERPVECYGGPEGTAGVGICTQGEHACVGGAWTECRGEVAPAASELCNELDDDCDGDVDEGVAGECGSCDPSCQMDSLGEDGESPWEPGEDNSEGVSVDDESGGLVLDSTAINTNLIWVANTAEGSVSKIDIRTHEQLGRYYTGFDPSRTSVNSLGDVYVGNRQGQSLTKVSALGDRCPDITGDGLTTTSSGSDLLEWGTDDCVLWRTELPGTGWVRAVAAQDEYGPDGELVPYVWVGGWDGYVWKLDGTTGAVIVNATPAPVQTYGFALDGSGNLWIESGGGLGRIDTNRCVDDASCAVEICGDDGDDCVKQRITQPVGGYGITVDFMQRVWIGGAVARYDPTAAAGARWTTVALGTVEPSYFVHGIAADGEGWVWGAGWSTVWRINANDPTQFTTIAAAAGYSAKGAAVDADGNVWMINYSNNNATVITPGEGLSDASVEVNVSPVFSTPYTYSDMTGSQLRFATNARGYYRALFEGCDSDTEWLLLDYDVFTPEGTSVLIRVRTADQPPDLEDADWVVIATIPDDEPPADIAEALADQSIEPGAYLEIEIQLSSEVVDGSTRITPVVYGASVSHACPPVIG